MSGEARWTGLRRTLKHMNMARAVAKKDAANPGSLSGAGSRDTEENAPLDDGPAQSLGHRGREE